MKKQALQFLFIFLLILCLSNTYTLHVQAAEQRQSTIDPELRKKVLAARQEALDVMRDYAKNTNHSLENRELAQMMAGYLEKAGIIPAGGSLLRGDCSSPNAEASTSLVFQVITLCPTGLKSSHGELVQIFIHEAYHLYEGAYYYPQFEPDFFKEYKKNPLKNNTPERRERGERRAATIELEIMTKTYGCVYSDTVYFSTLLHLQQGKDYQFCRN